MLYPGMVIIPLFTSTWEDEDESGMSVKLSWLNSESLLYMKWKNVL